MCLSCDRPRRRRQEPNATSTPPHIGSVARGQCLLAILAVTEGQSCDDVARTLRVTPTTVHQGLRQLLVAGRRLATANIPWASPKLTTAQPHELTKLMDAGPAQAGFPQLAGVPR